jgi:two-component system CheB/CheR fusion protein
MRRRRAGREPTKRPAARGKVDVFPIVGLGASAGGLQALELFFKHVPATSGTAFIVVQHLDPTRKDMLVELLQRASSLPVTQVTDNLRVKRGHVYVMPPNADMSMVNGVLHLFAPVAPRGFNLPIDFFFRSLADDLGPRSIGVVLSGMGSDGTLGLRAIHEKAGATFVQTPASAKFDAMPRSAIAAGLADIVALPESLPDKIDEYLEHARPGVAPDDAARDSGTESAVQKIVGLMRTATGHDFSAYKSSTVYRRIERRMGLHQLDDIASYVRYLRENRAEADLLFKELLIGVTSFFRDPAAWEKMKSTALPALLDACPRHAVLRAWVPACSTGEEAYSLGVVFREALEEHCPGKNIKLQIFGTDLDESAIERAREGLYPAAVAKDVSPERLKRFFVEDVSGYRVRPELRGGIIFANQNILQDPPFTKLDILTCRNLLIYLTPELQRQLLPLFHYSLRQGGHLFLGSAESIGSFSHLFDVVDGKSRIYRRVEPGAGAAVPVEFPSAFGRLQRYRAEAPIDDPKASAAKPSNLQALAQRLLLTRFAPAAVLVNVKGDILYVGGSTTKYLEAPAGKANWNVFAMMRQGLQRPVAAAFQRAFQTKESQTVTGLTVHGGEVGRAVAVTVEPVDEPAALRETMMIAFTDAPAEKSVARGPRAAKGRGAAAHARLEKELAESRDALRTAREDGQHAAEELMSTNEELQSMNEELQSTNEELMTSKEEMQSMNEELQTLNHELESKLDEHARTGNDMRNLLDSTEIAVLFLDGALNVRRFTPKATTLFKLIPGDVGRPLADLSSDLVYDDLYDHAREVLRTLVFKETLVADRRGRSFRVRVMPYRTSDNRIDGLVITLTSVEGSIPRPPEPRKAVS